MIPLLVCNKIPDLQDSFSLPSFARTSDWFGKKLPYEIRWSVACDRASLLFSAVVECRPMYNERLKPNIFAEGLWEQDLVEFFITEEGTDRYQEFNLSPAGAWWTQLFSGYRQREYSFTPVKKVEAFAEVTETGWRAAMKIPSSVVAIKWEPSQSCRINVTAQTETETQQRFISWMQLPESEPDFHRCDQFEQVDRTVLNF